MRGCLFIILFLFLTNALGAECRILFSPDPLKNLLGLNPSELSTHHLSQLSLQQNIKALTEISAGRPVDLKLYKEILQKDPFKEDVAMSAARLSAHGLLNAQIITKNLKNVVKVEEAIESGYQLQIHKTTFTGKPSNNVIYLNPSQQKPKQSLNSEANSTSKNVVSFGVSFQQILNAAMPTNLYQSGPIKVRLMQMFQQMQISQETISELRPMSSGELLSFKAAYQLSGSEVNSLRVARKTIDTASFIYLAQRAQTQLVYEQPFLELFYKRIRIKQPKLEEIVQVSEMIKQGEISLSEIITFLSEKSSINQRSQKPIFSLIQIAKILQLQNRNYIAEAIIDKILNHNSFLEGMTEKIKKRLFQRKTKEGFKVYDLKDDSVLSAKLYSLLQPEVVTYLALNPAAFTRFVKSFRAELNRKLPSLMNLLAQKLMSKPKREYWELELYNSLVSEAFSKAEKSL